MKLNNLFKVKIKRGKEKYYFLSFNLFSRKTKIAAIENKYKNIQSFDLNDLDREIVQESRSIYKKNESKFHSKKETNEKNIAFLATMFSDVGGHTEVVKNTTKLLSKNYNIKIFLTQKDGSYLNAPNKIADMEKYLIIDGIENTSIKSFNRQLVEIYNKIIDFSPKVLFAYIHPEDVLSTAALSLIKNNTDIKIIFFNHASHCKNLGFSLADLIIEGAPMMHYITKNYRNIDKCCSMGLPSKLKEDTKYLTEEEIKAKRKELGIEEENYFTLSGGSGFKFFDGEEKSEYFEMIRNLLIREPKLKHVIISNFNDKQKKVIENIFKNFPNEKGKLINIPMTPNFDPIFQSCDLYIDSFPMSSALTQIDMMRNKKPVVVKINGENSILSFHEYMPKDYPYMFHEVKDMENSILKLIYDKDKRKKISDLLYNYYLENYEGNAIREKYENLIENSKNLYRFYDELDKNLKYNIKL